MDEILGRIGARIRQLREKQGWSRDTLGKHCGLTRGAISAIEKGKSQARLGNFLNIAKALGTTGSKLLKEFE